MTYDTLKRLHQLGFPFVRQMQVRAFTMNPEVERTGLTPIMGHVTPELADDFCYLEPTAEQVMSQVLQHTPVRISHRGNGVSVACEHMNIEFTDHFLDEALARVWILIIERSHMNTPNDRNGFWANPSSRSSQIPYRRYLTAMEASMTTEGETRSGAGVINTHESQLSSVASLTPDQVNRAVRSLSRIERIGDDRPDETYTPRLNIDPGDESF